MAAVDLRSLSLIGAMRRVGRGWAGAWSHTAVDLSSLSLIGAMRHVGRGSGQRLVLIGAMGPGGTRAVGGGRERRWGGEGAEVVGGGPGGEV
jgi:hypothetical protein